MHTADEREPRVVGASLHSRCLANVEDLGREGNRHLLGS